MDTSQSSISMSRNGSQANVDPVEALMDFSEYDNMSYQSPSESPVDAKNIFVQPEAPSTRANSILPSNHQALSGPSHPYDLHKQQTGIPAGGLATTMAINSNSQLYAGYGYLSGVSPQNEFVDYSTVQSNQSSRSFDSVNVNDFEPTNDAAFFFPPLPKGPIGTEFVKPSNLLATDNHVVPSNAAVHQQRSSVGRLFPGMHQQQAMAKAQQQQHQRQQQQQRMMQPPRQNSVTRPPQQRQSKVRPATDPIVEEKITQLLASMRQASQESTALPEEVNTPGGTSHGHRSRKEDEDMDEDERLLASEEGKKLSSKERRQLRNKVSARAFRSRRKEYIGQLEGEIAAKVTENQRLQQQNQALVNENERLQDLTRLLLSSSSFNNFLTELSTNPGMVVPQQQRQQPSPPVEQLHQPEPQQQQRHQIRKDPNPYIAQQQQQDMNINFAMMPEQPVDFSMLDLHNNDFIYQPHVFSVHSVPQPAIDAGILSGKPPQCAPIDDEEKIMIPAFNPAPAKDKVIVEEPEYTVDDEFDSNPQFELFATTVVPKAEPLEAKEPVDIDDIVAAIKPAKAFLKFELVDATTVQQETESAMRRVRKLSANLESVMERLENLSAS